MKKHYISAVRVGIGEEGYPGRGVDQIAEIVGPQGDAITP
jgi:hypothetical protein